MPADYSIEFQGLTATSATNLVVGDVVCCDANSKFILATTANLGSGFPLGVCRSIGNPGTVIHVQYNGLVPAAVTGLTAGSVAFASVDTTTGRLKRVTSPDSYTMGRVTDTGAVALWGTPGMTVGLISGSIDTCIASGAITIGDLVTSALDATTPLRMKKATSTALASGGSVEGMALTAAADGQTFTRALPGSKIAPSASGLSTTTTRTVVVADGSGRCLAREVPRFAEDVVGYADTQGILHFIPTKSRYSETHVNAYDYGATGLDPAVDATDAVLAAVTSAWTNTGDAAYPNYLKGHIGPGVHRLTRPIRMNKSNIHLRGSGKGQTVLLPAFKGPTVIRSPSKATNPPVTTGGPFSGNCFYPMNGSEGYFYDLTQNGCAQIGNTASINGMTAFCCETWLYVPSGQEATGSDITCVAGSLGTETSPPLAGYDSAFMMYVTGNQGGTYTNDNIVVASLHLGGSVYTLNAESYPIAANTWTHVALDYDGAAVRLLVNGHVAMTSLATGTVTQQKWESVFLGSGRIGLTQKLIFGSFRGKIGPFRLRDASVYSGAVGTYTPPASAWAASFNDIFWSDWATVVDSDVVYGSYRDIDDVWLPPSSDYINLAGLLINVTVSDLTIYGNASVAEPGGIWSQGCVNSSVRDVNVLLCLYAMASYNNCFECHHARVNSNGGAYGGIIDMTTSGNVYSDCQPENHTWNFVFGGGVTLKGSTIGPWKSGGAGIWAWDADLELSGVFWDSEGLNYATRGCILSTNSRIHSHGDQISTGDLYDMPLVTVHKTDAHFKGTALSASPQTKMIDVLGTDACELIVEWLDYGGTAPYAPLLTDVTQRCRVPRRQGGDWKVCDYSSDADRTMTADEFTYGKIHITDSGVVLSAARNFVQPDIGGEQRTYWNDTAQDITVKTATGTGITLSPTDILLLVVD